METPAKPSPNAAFGPAKAIALHVVMMLLLGTGVWMQLLVPRYEELFRDFFGQEPLPPVAAFVFRYHTFLLGAACLAAFVYLCLVLSYRMKRPPVGALVALMAFIGIQFGVTAYAIYKPLITVVDALPPEHSVE
jgi:hypothetical protein